jgi:hypothetical protein
MAMKSRRIPSRNAFSTWTNHRSQSLNVNSNDIKRFNNLPL